MEKPDSRVQDNTLAWFDDPLWYKDAIIYELHIKAFFDSKGDGMGDFRGLTEKLDYLQDLGVNTLWLLPFYPSPLKDDGYDISDYRNVHPQYGTLADARQFVREAHRRGLKVITELVINHTSDQHPWFQAARSAPAGSKKRDFYVWSDTDKKFPETRIIFTDTEKSNWTWDEVAGAYYWHRFFSHQPDLNHNNPEVVRAVIRIMRFWFDLGVDGLRLDAIPYLCVREGTSNENLPETHAVIKQMRAVIDSRYENRLLLAEANQWPEDVREYFGDGDECHMAYHFPLMPRIYMAVAQEDRHPVVEIMQQTPDIPPTCQWAIFLRNHDELTLEMVTHRERDYMYEMYAADQRMRINVGIRRRLAPLMENNRDKIELVNFLLMTLPGSPIIYYGDEIGMGDNIYLGDRNGVRTPMQWSPDRNAGFSRADPQRLYLPPVMDPIYGYEAVNVEAQSRNPSSLLHWTRRLIAVRKNYKAFGRGTLRFLDPGNRKVLAYTREWGEEIILCVVNLSRSAQPVELDLATWKGRVPVELMGRTSFPPVGTSPYLFTLKGYGYYSFRLTTDAEVPYWHESHLPRAELPVLVLTEGWLTFLGGRSDASMVRRTIAAATTDQLQHEVLGPYLASKRWFSSRSQPIESIRLVESAEWTTERGSWLVTVLEVRTRGDAAAQLYFLPLAICWEDDVSEEKLQALAPWTLARVRQRARVGLLYGAFGDDGFCRALVRSIGRDLDLPLGKSRVEFRAGPAYAPLAEGADTPVRHPLLEQSNTTIYFGNQFFFKGYRRLQEGTNTEIEMGRFLTETSPFSHIVPLAGSIELRRADGSVLTLGLLQSYVEHQHNAWSFTVDYVERFLADRLSPATTDTPPDETQPATPHGFFLSLMQLLGQRTGELHRALSQTTGNAVFDPEPVSAADLARWSDEARERLTCVLNALEGRCADLPPTASDSCRQLLRHRQALLDRLAPQRLHAATESGVKIRCHGDYNLGQLLLAQNDFLITDFEGNTAVPLEMRRRKTTPLHDVATMLGCFTYAAAVAVNHATQERPDDRHRLGPLAQAWERETAAAFITGYHAACCETPTLFGEPEAARALLDFMRLDHLVGKLADELATHPEWLPIPLYGILRLLDADATGETPPPYNE